eukprot:8321347-Alexandrium_andersonii.AAC.1
MISTAHDGIMRLEAVSGRIGRIIPPKHSWYICRGMLGAARTWRGEAMGTHKATCQATEASVGQCECDWGNR